MPCVVPNQGCPHGLQCLGTKYVAHPHLGLTMSPHQGPFCVLVKAWGVGHTLLHTGGPPSVHHFHSSLAGLVGREAPGPGLEKSRLSPQRRHPT